MPEVLTEEWTAQLIVEHQELRAMVQEIRTFLDRPRPELGQDDAQVWATDLARHLLDLHHQLVRHFHFEEGAGMAEEIIRRHPHAARELEEILDGHPAILSRLREILTGALIYSEGHEPSASGLRSRVAKLLESLGKHEREETALIQSLEYRDIGVGD